MLKDLVIDTNVLLHADNPVEKRRSAALKFITALLDSETVICMDDGFDLDESINRSQIGHEYLSKFVPGSPAFEIVAKLAGSGCIKNLIVEDRSDRVFLKVSYNSIEKTLVSHDYTDFDLKTRRSILKELKIHIDSAEEAQPKL